MDNELRPFWNRFFDFNFKFGLFLILLVCVPRFILVLKANATGSYGAIGAMMLISAMAPFIFLNRRGREIIGIKKPTQYRWLWIALSAGLLASLALYLIGYSLYGSSYENWYSYIGKSYNIPIGIKGNDKAILFAIMAITGMIFSPIGEELFFRGIVHSSFAASIGEKKASVVDGAAFALTHISHFGFVFIDGKWSFFTMPAIIWVMAMFLVSLLFIRVKKYANSIVGSILCHAAFNLGMIYCIFYLL